MSLGYVTKKTLVNLDYMYDLILNYMLFKEVGCSTNNPSDVPKI